MEAGIELDILIAKKIMGLEVVSTTYENKKHGPVTIHTIGEPNYFDIQGDIQLQNYVPSYSSDIQAAWEVVEHLTADKKRTFGVGVLEASNIAFFSGSMPATAATVPQAICLAALNTLKKCD